MKLNEDPKAQKKWKEDPTFSFLSLIILFFLCFSLSSIIFIISDTNYWHLLLSSLHFDITSSHYKYLVLHLSISSIVFIIFKLIISIFYCLIYTLLLLHLITTYLVVDFIITTQLTYVLGNYHDLYKYH